MAASPTRRSGGRAQLGAPILPVNAPGRYLRHRARAEAEYRRRRQVCWLHRIAFASIACLLYFAIGRDLLAVARARKDSAVMSIRKDSHQIATDIERVVAAARLASDQALPPLTVASAKTTAEQADAVDVDALLAEPVDHRSRLHAGEW